MHEILHSLSVWHWVGLAVVLLIFEVLTGGGFLLWIGIAAAFVAGIMVIIPELAWSSQFIVFSLAAILSCILWWLYLKKNPRTTDQPMLNQRMKQYMGKVFILEEGIANGRGRIRIGDSVWQVTGIDMPSGSKVKVVDSEGTILKVEPME